MAEGYWTPWHLADELVKECRRLRENLKTSEERRRRQGAEITAGAQEQIGMINAECMRLEQRLGQQEALALQLCDAVENEDDLPPLLSSQCRAKNW